MKHTYKVHRVSWHPREITMTHPKTNEAISATVQALEVELVPHEHDGGSVTFRYVGSQADEAATLFHHGGDVELDITAVTHITTSPEVN